MTNDSDIFLLFNLPDDGSFKIGNVELNDNIKTIHIFREPVPTFCPECGCRMHSRGIKTRNVNHSVMQDTTLVYLKVDQRRWKCTGCGIELNEQFPFLERYSHSSNLTFYYVCEAMKDLNRSTASIARQFNMSDTEVHDIFTAHVDLPPLPLTEIISVDEVFLDIDNKDKYALVIMDFTSGEIIDILHNRWESTAENYFLSIPYEERLKVKYIISDAYRSYMQYPQKYFPNAASILDSFHVVKYLNDRINSYINSVMKRYKENDKERLEKKNHDFNLDNKTIRDSKEVVLLRDYRWILLKNKDEINYSFYTHFHSKLHEYTNTYRIEDEFLSLDSKFREIRNLKEEYIDFNKSVNNDEEMIRNNLDLLIEKYKASDIMLFREFADYLTANKESIIRSFTVAEVSRRTKSEADGYYARLSNGPMESFNRKPKDYKRTSRGFSNFHYTRNRILWATRKNPSYLGVPKSRAQIHSFRGKKRGKYKK